ncbi:MAG: DUF6209 family protein [Kofleriaceae bacterium]
MIRFGALLATGLVTAFAGCAETPAGEGGTSGKADGTLTRLTFDDSWRETADGPIVAGSPIRIAYDLDRLQDCRGETGGSEVWGATGYASFDGGEPKTFAVSRLDGGRVVAVEAELDVPSTATSVDLWFSSSNRWGCIAYDSNESANYSFEVEQRSDTAVLAFDADWTESQSGAVAGGGKVIVHYDPDRLSQCAGSSGGTAQWSVTGYYQVDGGTVKSLSVTRANGPDLVPSDPTITVPNGSELSLWFEATSRWGCHAYDSDFGANYRYDID